MQHQAKSYEQLLTELEQTRQERDRLAAATSLDKDFRAVFRASPDILLLLTPDLIMVDASEARLQATSTTREDIEGRYLFDVFPDNPDNEDAVGKSNLHLSLMRVIQTKQPHEMALQRYDLVRPDGTFEERYWRPYNAPVLGPDGELRFIIHRVEDATTEMRLTASEAGRKQDQQRAKEDREIANERLLEKVAELESAHRLLNGVMESSASGIAVFRAMRDAQGRIADFAILRVNPAGECIVGKSNQQLQGTTVLGNWPGHQASGLFDLYVRVANSGVPGEMELNYDADGLDVWLNVSVVKVDDGVAVTFTDIRKRKQTETELRRQKDLMTRIIDNAPISISYLDKHLVYQWVNPSQAETYQIPVEQWLGRTVYDVLGPETEAQTRANWEQALGGEPFIAVGFPFKYTTLSGEDAWTYWDYSYNPVRGESGEVEGILVLGQEVSARVEKEMLQAERVTLLETENERIEAQVAERTQELQALNEELAAQAEELQTQQIQLGGANALLQAQAKGLDEQKVFAENIIRHVPAAVAYLDRDLVFRFTNPIYDGILGIPGDRIKDRYVFDVLPGTEAQVEPLLRRVIDSAQTVRLNDFKFVYERDGEEVVTYWDFIYQPMILDAAEGVQGILAIAHDTSKRVEQEQERERYRQQEQERHLQRLRIEALEQADKSKDQFLGIVSHELRTPINAIMGFSSVLADGVAGDLNPDQARYIGKVLDSSDALLGLVNDLLDMSRVQAGKFALETQTVELASLVTNTLADLAAEAAQKDLSVIDALPADLPAIQADPQRVSQVLDNLVTNAIKYTPEGGAITLRAGVRGGFLRVEVADTGLGVPPDQQVRIFQSFTQVDMTSTRAKGGVGLGLSIVKALVEAHGGNVGVESAGEGRGSTFWFTLPLASR